MNINKKTGLAIVLLCLTATAQGDNTANALATPTDTESASRTIIIEKKTKQPELLLGDLHSHLLELRDTLSDETKNMTLVRTRTSWVRMQLRTLQEWSMQQTTSASTEKMYERFRFLVSSMLQEVERDDMLDDVEIQMLITNYTQITQILADIEHQQKQDRQTGIKSTE